MKDYYEMTIRHKNKFYSNLGGSWLEIPSSVVQVGDYFERLSQSRSDEIVDIVFNLKFVPTGDTLTDLFEVPSRADIARLVGIDWLPFCGFASFDLEEKNRKHAYRRMSDILSA